MVDRMVHSLLWACVGRGGGACGAYACAGCRERAGKRKQGSRRDGMRAEQASKELPELTPQNSASPENLHVCTAMSCIFILFLARTHSME